MFVKFCLTLSDMNDMVGSSNSGGKSLTDAAKPYAVVAVALAIFTVVMVPRAQAALVTEANAPTGALAVVVPAVDAFENSFSNYQKCLGEPTIVFEDLPGRKGEYRVGLSTVALNPNRSVDDMAQVVVHELAHHLMIECGIDRDQSFQEAFYASQGIPLTRGWYDYSGGWSATPAEQFSEAVSLIVLGTNTGRITISKAPAELVGNLAGPMAGSAVFVPKRAVGREVRSATGQSGLTANLGAGASVELNFAQLSRRTSLGPAVGLAGRLR